MAAISAINLSFGPLGIMFAGLTGSGKTTIMRTMFGEEIEERPPDPSLADSTRHLCEYQMPNCPIILMDTVGFERLQGGNVEASFTWLQNHIAMRARSETETSVHAVIYCIAEHRNRFEGSEIRFCQQLVHEHGIPVILAITIKTSPKSDHSFQSAIQRQLNKAKLEDVQVLEVLAAPQQDPRRSAHGMDALVHVIREQLPRTIVPAFLAAQRVSLELKKELALTYVEAAGHRAAIFARMGIPFDKFWFIIPNEAYMLVKIGKSFGMEFESAFVWTLITSTIGATCLQIVGRQLLQFFMKFLPGDDQAQEVVSAEAACEMTKVLGEMFVDLLYDLCFRKGTNILREEIAAAFRARMVQYQG